MYIHSSFVKINLVCLWVNQCEKIDLGQLTISGWGQSEEVLIKENQLWGYF